MIIIDPLLCVMFGHKWGKPYFVPNKVVAAGRGSDTLPYSIHYITVHHDCDRCKRTEMIKL